MIKKDAEIEYQEKLKKFNQYQKNGIDLAYRCYACGALTLQMDIVYGIGCPKCPSVRLYPITTDLTKFGLYYCLFRNWLREKYYFRKYGAA